MTTSSICEETEGKRSAGGAAGTAESDGMAGLTTSSIEEEEGGRTGLGEGPQSKRLVVVTSLVVVVVAGGGLNH